MSDWAKEVNGKLEEIPNNKTVIVNGSQYKPTQLSRINSADRIASGVYPIVNAPTPDITFLQKYNGNDLSLDADVVTRTKKVVDKTKEQIDNDVVRYTRDFFKQINGHRQALLDYGVEYDGAVFDTDSRSVLNLLASIVMTDKGADSPPVWRTKGNNNKAVGKNDLDNLAVAAFNNQNQIYVDSFTAKAQIEAVTVDADWHDNCKAIVDTYIKNNPIPEEV